MQVITANRLSDGRVVYLGQEKCWQVDIARAQRSTKEQGKKLLLNVDKATVVDPYLIDVAEAGDNHPSRYREHIRATGPSIDPGQRGFDRLAGPVNRLHSGMLTLRLQAFE